MLRLTRSRPWIAGLTLLAGLQLANTSEVLAFNPFSKAQKSVSQAAKQVGQQASKTSQQVQKVATQAQKSTSSAASQVKKSTGSATTQVKKTASQATTQAKKAVSTASKPVAGTVQKLQSTASSASKQAQESVRKTQTAAGLTAKRASDSAFQQRRNVLDTVASTGQQFRIGASTLQRTSSGIGQRAADSAHKAYRGAKSETARVETVVRRGTVEPLRTGSGGNVTSFGSHLGGNSPIERLSSLRIGAGGGGLNSLSPSRGTSLREIASRNLPPRLPGSGGSVPLPVNVFSPDVLQEGKLKPLPTTFPTSVSTSNTSLQGKQSSSATEKVVVGLFQVLFGSGGGQSTTGGISEKEGKPGSDQYVGEYGEEPKDEEDELADKPVEVSGAFLKDR